jgi:hypothetical protein
MKGYLVSLFDKEFIPTGVKTALFVGSLLFLINHGAATLRGEMTRDRWISGGLTYLMPYLVNVYGQHASRSRTQQSGLPSPDSEESKKAIAA